MVNKTTAADFTSFLEAWLGDVREGDPSTVELGNRFSRKLITQWLDVEEGVDDLTYCDGSGDGGIDVAYLHRGELSDPDNIEGDTWYLVQSKYGTAFAGSDTLLREGMKIINSLDASLDGKRSTLSSLSQGLIERIRNFLMKDAQQDKVVIVFATEQPLTDSDKLALAAVRAAGRDRLGSRFDVESISVHTIYERATEAGPYARITLALEAHLVESSPDLLVGTISLLNLYDFLKMYRQVAQDLDKIYEKNVRRFLGGRGRVNKAIQETLRNTPEQFGLFNNGVTIVVEEFSEHTHEGVSITEPYIVNGCQTTRTIWDVCLQRVDAGGSGHHPELDQWIERAGRGVVVLKLVRIGTVGEQLLQDITKHTNSQNAVRAKDFIALTSDFREWAHQMAVKFDIFLEIQRGGWDSQKAYQKQNPGQRKFSQSANGFDLIKVYAAGWLGEAGTAFGRNSAFLPGGSIFKRLTESGDGEDSLDVEDLYVAYQLQLAGDLYKFGRGALKVSRRQTRFVFYMVAVELLKDSLQRENRSCDRKALTRAMINLFATDKEAARDAWLHSAVDAIDEYLTPGAEDSVFTEPSYLETNDLNAYLKSGELGRQAASPRLRSLLAAYGRTMGRASAGQASPRSLIVGAV